MKLSLANNTPVTVDVPVGARSLWISNRTGQTVYFLPPNARAVGGTSTPVITAGTADASDGLPLEPGQDRVIARDEGGIVAGPWQFIQASGSTVKLDYAIGN